MRDARDLSHLRRSRAPHPLGLSASLPSHPARQRTLTAATAHNTGLSGHANTVWASRRKSHKIRHLRQASSAGRFSRRTVRLQCIVSDMNA